MADELTKGVPEAKTLPVAGSHPEHDPSYPDHGKFPGLPDHFSLVSAQKSETHDAVAHSSMTQELMDAGAEVTPVKSHYGHHEESMLVQHDGKEDKKKAIEQISWKYNQDSVVHHDKGKNTLVSREGNHDSKGSGFSHGPHLKAHFTQLPTGHRFQLNLGDSDIKKADTVFDLINHEQKKEDKNIDSPHHYGIVAGINVFHALHEIHNQLVGLHVKDADDAALEEAVVHAQENKHPAVILHGNPPPMLRESAPAAKHPHAYDWHNGHSDYYKPELKKSDNETSKPAPAIPSVEEPGKGDNQAMEAGGDTYRPIAEHFGKILPNEKTNLQFYRGIENLENQIDELIAKEGYQVYFAGGDHGDPDLANKNYDTMFLMLWGDPSDQDGFVRSYRKIHELAHALTRSEVNEIYGEGRRTGRLGERTPREAKRSAHWEWLTGHKQRELAKAVGFEMSDEDFSREMNTVTHDAVHRVITGGYADASDEGFIPGIELVPFEVGTRIIDEHAKKVGLRHDEATFNTTGVPHDVMESYQAISKAEGSSGALLEGGKIKKFYLWRENDASGVSGTGRVAEGVVFSNGWVGMNWLTKWGSLAFYPCISDVMQVHGHQGKTQVIYEDTEEVKKAFTQGDGETLTDPKSHDQASLAVPQSLMDWGVANLVPMVKDGTGEFELAGKTIKIRKVLEDLYTGWIEHANHIIHQFEKLTLPLVLSQLQSKLELYGKEESVVADKPVEEKKQEVPVVEIQSPNKIEEAAKSSDEYKKKLMSSSAGIAAKLKRLQNQLKEHMETIFGNELTAGIENPESECSACERHASDCICYLNLPKPRIEVTSKGVNIFFKSEWSEEDISNFKSDLIKRAGVVLQHRRVKKAKEALIKLRDDE